MMNFDEAFDRVIGHEGGYVNDPRDPGGETKYGISKRAYPKLNIRDLTLDQAKSIYKTDYWDKCHIEELPKQVRYEMFDMAVNAGVGAAIKTAQKALKVTADGIWGRNTTAAAAAVFDGELFHKRFAGHRLYFYTELPGWTTYGKGWTRRVASNLIEG